MSKVQFLEAAEAYLDYRRGDFDQAYARISKALAIDVVLEEEYGYEILHLHRIQLLHNLVRSDARRMQFASAIELACQLLGYLEGTSEVLPLSGSWGSEHIARQPSELVAAMFGQITDEVALILAGKNRQVKSELFAIAKRHIQLQANGNTRCHPQSHTWFLLKEAFVDNDVATFLERASRFLAEGRGDTPLLWYAVVVDIVALCNQLDLPEEELFKREVAKDAVSFLNLPERFVPLLRVPAKMLNHY
ncbi:MAG: hypothetical protein ACHBN1_31625 [Heteroscytonema crispum UTEX LB 1556]